MTRDSFHYTGCGLRNIYLRNGYAVEKTAYGRATAIEDVEGLHKAIGLHLVHHKARLSGAEVRFLRKELDMPQALLGQLIGAGETTIRHWESGRGRITRPAERMLRLLFHEWASGPSPVREIVERLSRMNRDTHAGKVVFEETRRGWREVA